jgi:pyruvate formate lyase activating enzyme
MRKRPAEGEVFLKIDGKPYMVPEGIPIQVALELAGLSTGAFPGETDVFIPCGVGGCMACAVTANGEQVPACVTGIEAGMEIRIETPADVTPRRGVHGFQPHAVGGVGTPWHLKDQGAFIEVACFACGCNFRCPQCQNWQTAYNGKEAHRTPEETALGLTLARRRYGVDRLAISGGECTLNRPWLVAFIAALRKHNPDDRARFHVDTNGSILIPDYIDELIDAGMTDVGIDLKSLKLETFRTITGVEDEGLAARYRDTAWEAVRHIRSRHRDEVFLGVGIPYNARFMSFEELEAMGRALARIDPRTQVCVLDYRPEYRRLTRKAEPIERPDCAEMRRVFDLLRSTGLKTVLCQTPFGHIGPR